MEDKQKKANREKHAKSLKRAEACPESSLRTNVIANLEADAYKRPEDIESDLKDLEERARASATRARASATAVE